MKVLDYVKSLECEDLVAVILGCYSRFSYHEMIGFLNEDLTNKNKIIVNELIRG